MRIIPSRFRHKVMIQQRSTVTDQFGQQSTSWSDVASVWAGIDNISAMETEQGSAVNFIATHRVYMRYTPLINHKMRICLKGNKFLRIININNDQEINHSLELICQEIVTDD